MLEMFRKDMVESFLNLLDDMVKGWSKGRIDDESVLQFVGSGYASGVFVPS